MLRCHKMSIVVSIILPTYNRAVLLRMAINSVLSQSYQNFELIIIDDASSDQTEALVKSFRDKRIKYLRNKKRLGANWSRNIGIKKALGKYIAFQDSDDQWLPEKLGKQISIIEKSSPKVGAIYSKCLYHKGDRKKVIPSDRISKKEGCIHENLLNDNFITLPSLLIKKECFNQIGYFDESLPRLQDWDLVLRISQYYQFIYINEILLHSNYTPGSITSNKRAVIEALKLILKKNYKELLLHKKILSRYYFNLGSTYYKTETDLQEARKFIGKAINLNPLKILYLFSYICSFLGVNSYNKLSKLFHKVSDDRFSK